MFSRSSPPKRSSTVTLPGFLDVILSELGLTRAEVVTQLIARCDVGVSLARAPVSRPVYFTVVELAGIEAIDWLLDYLPPETFFTHKNALSQTVLHTLVASPAVFRAALNRCSPADSRGLPFLQVRVCACLCVRGCACACVCVRARHLV